MRVVGKGPFKMEYVFFKNEKKFKLISFLEIEKKTIWCQISDNYQK